MNTALQHLAIRPFIGLLAAFVLASSATVAVAAETHAAKPPPLKGDVVSVSCTVTYNAQTDSYTTAVDADFSFLNNKGGWVFVRTEYMMDPLLEWTEQLPAGSKVSRKAPLQLSRSESGVGSVGGWKVTMTDRNGDEFDKPIVATTETDCVGPTS